MVSFKNLFFLITAVSAVVVPRTAATIQSDLNTIDSDTRALTSAVNNYSGGTFGAIPVQNAYKKLDDDVKTATTNVQNDSSTISSADAQKIIDYINNTLVPDVTAAINALISKKSQFTAGGVAGQVSSDLKQLRGDVNSYGTALINKAPSDKKSAGQTALSKVIAQIDRGISAYA